MCARPHRPRGAARTHAASLERALCAAPTLFPPPRHPRCTPPRARERAVAGGALASACKKRSAANTCRACYPPAPPARPPAPPASRSARSAARGRPSVRLCAPHAMPTAPRPRGAPGFGGRPRQRAVWRRPADRNAHTPNASCAPAPLFFIYSTEKRKRKRKKEKEKRTPRHDAARGLSERARARVRHSGAAGVRQREPPHPTPTRPRTRASAPVRPIDRPTFRPSLYLSLRWAGERASGLA